jgi:hypothetical protein
MSILLLGGAMLAVGGLFLVSSLTWAPAPAVIGTPPTDLPIEAVSFESTSIKIVKCDASPRAFAVALKIEK